MVPILKPATEKKKVVIPIISTVVQIFIFTQASDIPDTIASMLVATAKVSMTRKSVESLAFSSLLQMASRIMLHPIANKSPKATHAAYFSMNWLNVDVRKYPIKGIRAWKKPNQKPHSRAFLHVNCRDAKPFEIDTEKASIESPTAKMNISKMLISFTKTSDIADNQFLPI